MAATRISLAATAALAVLAGCGGGAGNNGTNSGERHALQSYVSRIEPLRLSVNTLLDGADPILSGYTQHQLTAAQAQRRLRVMERRFAGYMRRVRAVRPVPPDMRAAQRAYVHTYVQQDAYLRALIAALPSRDWSTLPQTEQSQRRALVAWRAKLALQAARLDVALPEDIDIVGRDEVVPSPNGES